MLYNVLWWWPSSISDPYKNKNFFLRSLSNYYSCSVQFNQVSNFSENYLIILPKRPMLNLTCVGDHFEFQIHTNNKNYARDFTISMIIHVVWILPSF
jgi:hypothetical protein